MYFSRYLLLVQFQSFQWTSYSFLFGFFFVRLRIVSQSLPRGNSLSPHSPSSKNLKNKLRINSLSRTRFSNGAAKVRIIFKLPNFFAKIFQFVFLRQSFRELSVTLFSNGSAKVQLFYSTPNFSLLHKPSKITNFHHIHM